MVEKITYKIATNEDYPAVLQLYNKMYGAQRSLSDIEWMVDKNPAGKAVHFIALIDNEVVGMQSLIPYHFVLGGVKTLTFKSEDSLIKKELRGKGIFSKLYEMVHDYADGRLVWGLTDKKEILERLKMPSSERLTIAVSVKKPGLVKDKGGMQRSVVKTLYYSYLYLKSTFKSRTYTPKLELSEIKAEDFEREKTSHFFDKLSKENPGIYYPQMDSDYLKWRLVSNPNFDSYKMFVSTNDQGAITMCSLIGLQGKSAHWLSFYALNEMDEDERLAHISVLRKRLFDSGINMIHAWLFQCNEQTKKVKAHFLKSGFYAVREGLWIVHNSQELDMDVHDLYFSGQLGIR